MTPERLRAMLDLVAELPLIEHRLRQAGLWKTAVKMNETVKSAGFEAADVLEAAIDAAKEKQP